MVNASECSSVEARAILANRRLSVASLHKKMLDETSFENMLLKKNFTRKMGMLLHIEKKKVSEKLMIDA